MKIARKERYKVMYTGIIQTKAKVSAVERKKDFLSFEVELDPKFLDGVFIGASCAINGACFTVVKFDHKHVGFDAIAETIKCTTIGSICVGDTVHFERSAKYGDENGGHAISGHVHGVCEIIRRDKTDHNLTLVMRLPIGWSKYVFEKGYISLHGASLTVVSVRENEFSVSLIPETLRQTNLGTFDLGQFLNFEVEQQTRTLVDVIERTLERQKIT